MSSKPPRQAFTRFGVVLLGVLALSLVLVLNVKTVQVSGNSMKPTFQNGQRLVVTDLYWLVGAIRDNDIVVFHGNSPREYIIKRVYRMAGETVDPLNQPRERRLSEGPFVVPPDTVFVLGDNRGESEDSRAFGPLPRSKIIGKVVLWR